MSEYPTLPSTLIPADPRFGCGPSKVRPAQLNAIVNAGADVIGTSHRQPAVKNIVGSIREGLSSLFSLPDGYEIVLSLGGATAFWDAATFGLIEKKSGHLTFGEFSGKFAKASAQAPWLDEYRGLNILHIFNAIYAGSCTFHSFTIGATLEL